MKRPSNNWMQLTRSARCKGGYAPPSQLIQVFGGQGAQTEDVPFASCPAIGDSNNEADDPICYPSSMAKGGKDEN